MGDSDDTAPSAFVVDDDLLPPRRASFGCCDDGAPPWELIDALLGGPSAGASDALPRAAEAAEAAAAVAPPALQGPSEAGVGLKCLDPAHTQAGAGCAVGPPACGCVQPPSAADLPFFRLSSPQRCGESGEKRLRRLLIAAPEWQSQQERFRLAQQVEAEGKQALADVLRGGRCSALRKATMADLCRYWGYRCDVFRPLGTASPTDEPAGSAEEQPLANRRVRRRVAPAAPAVAERAAQPSLSLGGAASWLQCNPYAGSVLASPSSVAAAPAAAVDALRATIATVVMPLLRDALTRHAGKETLAALSRDPSGLRAQFMADRLTDNELCTTFTARDVELRRSRVSQAQDAAENARPRAGLFLFPAPPPPQSSSEFTPAWAVLRGSDKMMVDSVRTVSGMIGRGLGLQEKLRQRLASTAPLTPVQRAWFADLDTSCEAMLCAFAHLEGAAAALQLAPWAQYLDAVVCTEDLLHQFSAGLLNSLRRRREWMLAAAAQGAAAQGASPAPMQGLEDHLKTMMLRVR